MEKFRSGIPLAADYENLTSQIPGNKIYGSVYLRLLKYGFNWKNASLNTAINKYTPLAPGLFNAAGGKMEYLNSQTGVKIVHDIPSNYFRIFDKSGNPLGIDGKPVSGNNNQIQANTHFLNSDNTTLPVTILPPK
ncbi:MAG: hypothetical protein QM781_13120 [Chitinophagaceae bacterium]